jgi:ribosome biogenesis GTPase A
MGKKNKLKKLKHKKKKSNSLNAQNGSNPSNIDNENAQTGNNPQKKKISKEFLHKRKEIRRKIKRIHKKNKKKAELNGVNIRDLYEFEDFFMNGDDLEKLPHDKFGTYNIPNTIEENKKYIPKLINESDIILELLDARDVYHSKNKEIEDLINKNDKKLLVFVVTKSDLVTNNYLEKIKKFLEEENNNKNPVLITSSLIREKIHSFFDELKDQIAKFLVNNIDKTDDAVVKIGIMGAPNVGKNSLIQSLELIIDSNCEQKNIYFDEEKSFYINSVPGILFDENDNNNFLISKKYKEVKDIPDPINLIRNLLNVVDKNKLKDIYELDKVPENLDEFINLIKLKYEFDDNNMTIYKILTDIITGTINYEVDN